MNGDMTYTLIMIIILIAVFYLFMIRPESKRKKQQEEMRSNLRKGDQITTIGGVVGRAHGICQVGGFHCGCTEEHRRYEQQ